IWGTGMASREFLYVEDAAEAIAMATELYDGPEPVNIGAGFEITIADLAKIIAEKCGYVGETLFDPAYPDGQPRRCLDVSRAEKLFGFKARTLFGIGLDRTVKWFRENHRK
ncbi:MAG: NAD-dependent epimerase/dehydratase family protein, partial [Candidatus Brocadiia bacterium]